MADTTQNINYKYREQGLDAISKKLNMTNMLLLKTVNQLQALNSVSRRTRMGMTKAGTATKGMAKQTGMLGNNVSGLAMRFVGYNLVLNQVMGAQQKVLEFTKESITKFREFEKAVAEVSTILNAATMTSLPELRAGMESLSVTFGKAAVDTAGGVYQILSAAFDATDAIQLLTIATKASVAGLSDVETSVDILTSVLNAYGKTASQAARISDFLFQTVVRGKLRFEDFASALGFITPIAANIGIEFKEISAAMSTATRMGLHADMTVRGLALGLQNLVSPTEQVIKAAKKYGIEIGALSVRTLGLQGMMQQLHEASKIYGDHIIGEIIPNMRSLRVFSALAGDEGIMGLAEDMDLLTESAGRTEEAMSKITMTTNFMAEQMTQAMEQIKRDFGATMTFMELNFERTKLGLMSGLGNIVNSIEEFGQSWTDVIMPLSFFWNKFTEGADESNQRIRDTFNATAEFVKNTLKFQYAETGKKSLYEALVGEDADIDKILTDMGAIEDIQARIAIKGEQAFLVGMETGEIDVQMDKFNKGLITYDQAMEKVIEITQRYSIEQRLLSSELLLTENTWNDVTGALASFEETQKDINTTISQLTITLSNLADEVGNVGEMYDGTLGETLKQNEAVASLEDKIRALQRAMKGQVAELSLVSDEMRKHIEAIKKQKEAYDDLSLAMKKNQLEIMKVQLKGMLRRRGLMRSEQKLIKKFQIDNTKLTIEQMQMKIDAEEAGELESKEILNSELQAMRDSLFAMKDTRWEDIENLRETILAKEDEIGKWTNTLAEQQTNLEKITLTHTAFMTSLYKNMTDDVLREFERLSGYTITPTTPTPSPTAASDAFREAMNIPTVPQAYQIIPLSAVTRASPTAGGTSSLVNNLTQNINATLKEGVTVRELANLLAEATRSALLNQQGKTNVRIR